MQRDFIGFVGVTSFMFLMTVLLIAFWPQLIASSVTQPSPQTR